MAKENTPEAELVQAPEGQLALRVALELGAETETFYANYAEVTQGAYEIGLSFVHLPTKLSSAKLAEATTTGVLTYEVRVHVALPHVVARGLIKALQSQLDLLDQVTSTAANESQEPTK